MVSWAASVTSSSGERVRRAAGSPVHLPQLREDLGGKARGVVVRHELIVSPSTLARPCWGSRPAFSHCSAKATHVSHLGCITPAARRSTRARRRPPS
jgi:hypothetical protein